MLTKIVGSLGMLPMLLPTYNWNSAFWTAFGLILALVIIELLDEFRSLWSWLGRRPVALRWGFYYAVLGCLVILGNWGVSQFVYMQF